MLKTILGDKMKVMWICNLPVPAVAEKMSIVSTPKEGWVVSVFEELSKREDIELSYVFVSEYCEDDITCIKSGQDNYISIKKNSSGNLSDMFSEVFVRFKPDVIHIWGTEKRHSFEAVKAAEKLDIISNVVVSIQGLVSFYENHYFAGIPGNVQIIPTLRDVIRKDTIKKQKNDFRVRGEYEQKTIKTVKHVIGRTFWDRACVGLINPEAKYYFNNETMRESFYKNKWSRVACEPHSIFVSQAQYPIKGFHYLLNALSILKEKYPDVTIKVSGNDNSFKSGLLVTAYGRYVQKLIKKYELENNVTYVGLLNEEQMVKQYLNAEVFVSPSVIENSPNSVCEAMLLGMPIVSSNVGGVSDLLIHEKEGFLYQADAPYLLAYYVSKLFDSRSLEEAVGTNARIHANKTNNKEKNINDLICIYEDIIRQEAK